MSEDAHMAVVVAVAAFGAGAGLGWLFFAGLYRTVRALGRSRHPALLLGASLLLRMLLLLSGCWVLLMAGERWAGDGWVTLVPGLLGIIAARALLLRRFREPRGGVADSPGPTTDGAADDNPAGRQPR